MEVFLSNCEGAQEILKSLVKKDKPVFLTWLPLSHSYEHTVQYVQISLGAKFFMLKVWKNYFQICLLQSQQL